MTKDPVDFVRQGAYISLSMILIQQNPAQVPKVNAIRELLAKSVADKHEDPMARFGASIAQGIIDAGGRNMTLGLASRAGTLDARAVVGATLFVQFWYWFPLAHCLGLAFAPTAVVAVDGELRVPVLGEAAVAGAPAADAKEKAQEKGDANASANAQGELVCHGKLSVYGYPVKAAGKKEEEKKKAKTAVLSTTARARARERKKKEEEGEGDVVSGFRVGSVGGCVRAGVAGDEASGRECEGVGFADS
jgi:26S proteasome regulatory subunit N2